MGGTSSGLLDEERDAGASSTNEVADNSITASGEKNTAATVYVGIGQPQAGSKWVCWEGPCVYTLEKPAGYVAPTTTTTTTTTSTTVTVTTTTTT